MVDSGVNHNFIREDVVQDIGLQLETMKTTFKYANLGVEKDIFTTKEIMLKLGDCSGSATFTIVPMDDFEAFLG